MSGFIASNGYQIEVSGWVGYVRNVSREERHVLGRYAIEALREFFEMENDKHLNRWRWPELSWYLVYPSTNGWVVLNETNGHSKHYKHRDHARLGSSNFSKAARAYFEAHPERKPWHEAKTGEVWVITVDGEESAWTVNNKEKFENPDSTYELTNPHITAARRIWPVSDD